MSKKIFLIAFIVAAIVQLLAILGGWSQAGDISKCLLLPALCGYYVASGSRSIVFVGALFFCWVGDVLLIFQQRDEMFFMGGLAAFLTGHVLYIVAYRQHRSEDRSLELLNTQKVRFALPVLLAATGLFTVLLPMLGGLAVPVLLYTIVIALMVMNAIFRYGRTNASSFWLVFGGALLFMVSDSILALNKFLSPLPLAGFWIMMTYIGAQLMIVAGIRKH
jgi:uncharacterized membrane protein YhhN